MLQHLADKQHLDFLARSVWYKQGLPCGGKSSSALKIALSSLPIIPSSTAEQLAVKSNIDASKADVVASELLFYFDRLR